MDVIENKPQGNPQLCKLLLDELRQNQEELVLEYSNYRAHALPGDFKPTTLPDHLLLFILNKPCEIQIEGSTFQFSPETLLYIQPETRHHILISKNSRNVIFYRFPFRFTQPLFKEQTPPFFSVSELGNIRREFELLFKEFRIEKSAREYRVRGLLLFILGICLHQLTGPEVSKRKLPVYQNARLNLYLKNNITKRILPRDLARHLKISMKYFTLLFRNTYGISPREWIVKKRIHQACVHLGETSENISEVAHMVGYKNTFLFSRQFKKIMGHSPMIYRKIR